jgi:hypothetical protein
MIEQQQPLKPQWNKHRPPTPLVESTIDSNDQQSSENDRRQCDIPERNHTQNLLRTSSKVGERWPSMNENESG